MKIRKAPVVALCGNAIVSASSGIFVEDIRWYFYSALSFAFVNLVCSLFLFYGLGVRKYIYMIPYIICICVNMAQCSATFVMILSSEEFERKVQVYLFLIYLGIWMALIPVQFFITVRYCIRKSRQRKGPRPIIKFTEMYFQDAGVSRKESCYFLGLHDDSLSSDHLPPKEDDSEASISNG